MQFLKVLLICCLFICSLNVKAGLITSDIIDLGSDEYQISYTIENNGATDFDNIILNFDWDKFSIIDVISYDSFDGVNNYFWGNTDILVFQPGSGLPGVVDLLSDFPITPGEILSGFELRVSYTGNNSIASWAQSALLIDNVNNNEESIFVTSNYIASPVPEPYTLVIFFFALSIILLRKYFTVCSENLRIRLNAG